MMVSTGRSWGVVSEGSRGRRRCLRAPRAYRTLFGKSPTEENCGEAHERGHDYRDETRDEDGSAERGEQDERARASSGGNGIEGADV